MKDIIELFGAGASANCLPTYGNFSGRFNTFHKHINQLNSSAFPKDYKDAHTNLLNSIKELQEEFHCHNTPDTIAKKYFHSTISPCHFTKIFLPLNKSC